MFSVETNRTIDFGLAIMRVVRAKAFMKDAKDLSIEPIPEIGLVITEMQAHISVGKMERLKRFVSTYYFHIALINYAYEYPDKSLEALAAFFEEQTPQQFLDHLNKLTLRGAAVTDNETVETAVKSAIEKANANNAVQYCMSYRTYKKIKNNPKEAQDLFLECIRYFKPIYELFSERIEAIRALKSPYYVAQFKEPSKCLKISNLVSFGESAKAEFPKMVYLSVFLDSAISMTVSEERGSVFIIFGVSLESLFEERNLDQEVIKCLADPTKMEMLRIMGTQEVCAKDLVSLLKLSKSNISHHIGKLTYAELITIQVKEGNRAYYSVNTSRIEAVFERIIGQLKGKENGMLF